MHAIRQIGFKIYKVARQPQNQFKSIVRLIG